MPTCQSNSHFPRLPGVLPVVVVGAGPVGLIASLLLSKYRVRHLLVEQQTRPDNHPQAHFINQRSMEVFRELDRLDRAVLADSAPIDEWRRFVYCTSLYHLPDATAAKAGTKGSMIGVVDHLGDGGVEELSPGSVTHFPQHDFVRLLRRRVENSHFCHLLEGYRADAVETSAKATVVLTDVRTGQQHALSAQFVIGADGADSAVRNRLNIELADQSGTLGHLINVHFFCRPLAERLRSTTMAMLYFVYSPVGVGGVVAHSLMRGEFVAQIPFYPPLQSVASFSERRCSRLIQQWIGRQMPIHVKSIRQWRMRTGLAFRFRSPHGRCFLVGDAAHQFTPAGGFGMNTGIQDAHNLIWKIVLALQSDPSKISDEAEQLLDTYEAERRPVAADNARWSVENYERTLLVPAAMGLNPSVAKTLHRLCARLPGPLTIRQALFAAALKIGLRQVAWLDADHAIARYRERTLAAIFDDAKHRTLQLLFPGQDLGFCYAPAKTARCRVSATEADPLNYTPRLRTGGRMPHFWIYGATNNRVSVLDLPSLMINDDGLPQHVMIMLDAADPVLREKAGKQTERAHPTTMVTVGMASAPPKAHQFQFNGTKPAFLPSSAAILMRPDGHIQWKTHP